MDLVDYARFGAALIFVLGLIFALSLLLRRMGVAGALAIAKPKSDRRLSVVENLPLDSKRRLVLLRCDDREHLVLLGPGQDVLLGRHDAPARPSLQTDLPGGDTQ